MRDRIANLVLAAVCATVAVGFISAVELTPGSWSYTNAELLIICTAPLGASIGIAASVKICGMSSALGQSCIGSPLLPYPPSPGFTRTCPKCSASWMLEHVKDRDDPLVGRLSIYRCAQCGKETTFASRHPPGAI